MAWKWCSDGVRRWGPYGAAGILFRDAPADSPDRYYLVRRGHSTHFGGTWGIPGGALDQGETPWEAARRETLEEVGYAVSSGEAPGYEDALATDWSYWTFVVTVQEPFVGRFNWEVSEEGWFTVDEIAAMNVLPALAATFPGLALLGQPDVNAA